MQRLIHRLAGREAIAMALGVIWLLCVANALGLLGSSGVDFIFQDIFYSVLIAAAATACLVRGITARTERLPWILMGSGLVCWMAADLYWILIENSGGVVPSPSIGDLFYLAFYPAAYAALVVLVRQRAMVGRTDLWLDGAIGASCAAAVTVALVLPAFDITSQGVEEMGINIAYPVLDVVLLVFVIMVVALSGWRPGRSWTLLGAAVAIMAVADSAYLIEATTGSYQTGQIVDAGWAASTLLIALAAWHVSDPDGRLVHDTDRRLVLIPFFCGLFALVVVGLGLFGGVTPIASVLALCTLLLVTLRMALAFRDVQRTLLENRDQAMTDGLTGLANRRRLLADLPRVIRNATPSDPCLCILLDLDGFKAYNDNFGHPAGDDLLARLGQRLQEVAQPDGTAYRLGGDEFCLLVGSGNRSPETMVATARRALSEAGEAFDVTASAGAVLIPLDAANPVDVLHLADRRMYVEKGTRSSSTDQSHAVLVRLLRERAPDLQDRRAGVAALAIAVGRTLAMQGEELDELARAAELYDIGKIAIPDTILAKPGPLDPDERSFMERHPVIGERILGAAPALRPVAQLVRGTQERYDGTGYPDGLAGQAIPLGARIVTACEAYAAMVSDESGPGLAPSAALADLRRRSGSSFDPGVVEALAAVVPVDGQLRLKRLPAVGEASSSSLT